MDIARIYATTLAALVQEVIAHGRESVALAADHVAARLAAGRVIYVVGTGAHSYMCAEEMFYRAGGLVQICPLLDAQFCLANGGRAAILAERREGYMRTLLDSYGIGRGDLLVICNVYGINAATIEAAMEMRRRAGLSIAVTSPQIARGLSADHPARHSSGQNLCDVADVVIDARVPMGDATVTVDTTSPPMCPVSTALAAFCLHWLCAEAASLLSGRGQPPAVWQSANSPGGDERNRPLLEQYGGIIKHL